MPHTAAASILSTGRRAEYCKANRALRTRPSRPTLLGSGRLFSNGKAEQRRGTGSNSARPDPPSDPATRSAARRSRFQKAPKYSVRIDVVRELRELHVGKRQVVLDGPHLARDDPKGAAGFMGQIDHQDRPFGIGDREPISHERERVAGNILSQGHHLLDRQPVKETVADAIDVRLKVFVAGRLSCLAESGSRLVIGEVGPQEDRVTTVGPFQHATPHLLPIPFSGSQPTGLAFHRTLFASLLQRGFMPFERLLQGYGQSPVN